jgi:hypothetical protein
LLSVPGFAPRLEPSESKRGDFALRIQGEHREKTPLSPDPFGNVWPRTVATLDYRGSEAGRNAALQLLDKFIALWEESNPSVEKVEEHTPGAPTVHVVGGKGNLHGFVSEFNTLAACIKHLNIDASDLEISPDTMRATTRLKDALFGTASELLPCLLMVALHNSPTFSTRFPAELQQSIPHLKCGPHECPQLMVHVWSAEFNDPDAKYPFTRKPEDMQARVDTRLAFMAKYAACLAHLPAASILTMLHQMNLELVMNAKWDQPLDGDRCGQRIRLLMACGSLLAKLAPQHAMAPESWRPMVGTLCRHVASELMQLFIVAERTHKVDWGVDNKSYGQTKVPLKEVAAEIESALACALSWRLADEAQMCLDWVESASKHAWGDIANVFEDIQQRCQELAETTLADVPHSLEDLHELKKNGFSIRLTGSWRDGYAIHQDGTPFDAQEHAGAVINYVRARLSDLEGSRFSIAGTQPFLDLLLEHLHELGKDDRAALLALISPMLQRLDMLARHQIGNMYKTDLAAKTTLRLLQAKLLLEIDKRLGEAGVNADARTAAENWLAEQKRVLFTQLHPKVVDSVLNQGDEDIDPDRALAPPVLSNLFEPLLETAIQFFSAAGPARAQEAHTEAMRFLKACAGSNAELRLAVFRCERAPLKLDPGRRSTEVSALLELAMETAAEDPEPTGRLLLAVLDFVVECVVHAKENDDDKTIDMAKSWAEQTISRLESDPSPLPAVKSTHSNALMWPTMARTQLRIDEENLEGIVLNLRDLSIIDARCAALMKAVMDRVLDNSELTQLVRFFTMSADLAELHGITPGKTPWFTADMLKTCLESCIDVLDEVEDEAQRAEALKLFEEVFRELHPRHAKSVVDACRSLGSRNHLEGWNLCLHCARLLGPGTARNKFLTAAFATALEGEPPHQEEDMEDMEAIGLWMHTDELHGLAGDDPREFRNLMDWR